MHLSSVFAQTIPVTGFTPTISINERMTPMANKQQFSQEMKNYYEALPAFVQESISQSTSSFNNLDELRAFAEKVCAKRKGDSCGRC